ncbi:hypothetical protein [Streptomyces sp. DG2A-72]
MNEVLSQLLKLVEPAVVQVTEWRPEYGDPVAVDAYCGVGRKP